MPPKENEKLYSNKEINVSQSEQENAMRYNNLDDLLQLSFTLKISIFSEVSIPSRTSMMELLLQKY